jgi:hypothetical protein
MVVSRSAPPPVRRVKVTPDALIRGDGSPLPAVFAEIRSGRKGTACEQWAGIVLGVGLKQCKYLGKWRFFGDRYLKRNIV